MKISRRQLLKTGFVSALIALLTDSLWAEKYFIETKEFNVGDFKASQRKVKLIQVSDLHLQSVNSQLQELAQKINLLQPELILFTGDSIDRAENISILDEFLKLIDRNIQKVAILGNWEYWGRVNIPKLKDIYRQHNCLLLINETHQFNFSNKSISITGVDDYVGGNANIMDALKNYSTSDYHIVLSHCPEYSGLIQTAVGNEINVDFILSGHTHGGQINIFGFTPFLPRGSGKFVKGWYRDRQPSIYVSRGIGTSILPVRLGARAEVTIFNLPG